MIDIKCKNYVNMASITTTNKRKHSKSKKIINYLLTFYPSTYPFHAFLSKVMSSVI